MLNQNKIWQNVTYKKKQTKTAEIKQRLDYQFWKSFKIFSLAMIFDPDMNEYG